MTNFGFLQVSAGFAQLCGSFGRFLARNFQRGILGRSCRVIDQRSCRIIPDVANLAVCIFVVRDFVRKNPPGGGICGSVLPGLVLRIASDIPRNNAKKIKLIINDLFIENKKPAGNLAGCTHILTMALVLEEKLI